MLAFLSYSFIPRRLDLWVVVLKKAYQMADQIGKINAAQGHFTTRQYSVGRKKPVEAEREFLEMVKADPTYNGNLVNFYLGQKEL